MTTSLVVPVLFGLVAAVAVAVLVVALRRGRVKGRCRGGGGLGGGGLGLECGRMCSVYAGADVGGWGRRASWAWVERVVGGMNGAWVGGGGQAPFPNLRRL